MAAGFPISMFLVTHDFCTCWPDLQKVVLQHAASSHGSDINNGVAHFETYSI